MKLHEIKNITEDAFYESFMANESFVADGELLEEGAKELFAAGKKALGKAAGALSDAVDAPAQKAWAEVQSRLATAGKDGAVQQLKDFASKHKVAIGTLAILGAGLLISTDASAGDAIVSAAGDAADAAQGAGGTGVDPDLMSRTQADIVRSSIGAKVGNVEVTKDMVLDAVRTGKFPGGLNMREYMTQVYSKAPSAQAATQMAKAAWNQVLMAKLGG